MKYLNTVFGIIGLITLFFAWFMWPEKQLQPTDVAVTINGHALAKSNLVSDLATDNNHHDDDRYQTILDSAITRELLLQEAQRRKIDKEEAFRKTLKNFYEQSLLNTLLDRQYEQLEVEVTEKEIEQYLDCFGKMISFTRLEVAQTPPYSPTSDQGPQYDVLFDDLAVPLQMLIAQLQPGMHAVDFDTGNERYAIRLDNMENTSAIDTLPPSPELIREMLEENKRQQNISSWLNELRNNASITIPKG